MRGDSADPDQPTGVDFKPGRLNSSEKGNHPTSHQHVQEKHTGALKEGLSNQLVQTPTPQAVLSKGVTTTHPKEEPPGVIPEQK